MRGFDEEISIYLDNHIIAEVKLNFLNLDENNEIILAKTNGIAIFIDTYDNRFTWEKNSVKFSMDILVKTIQERDQKEKEEKQKQSKINNEVQKERRKHPLPPKRRPFQGLQD